MLYYDTLTSKDKAKLFYSAGKCKICSGKSGSNRLVTDHCHTTGVVRGVLCERCNSWLGVIEGGRDTETRIKYIQKLEAQTGIRALNFMFYLDNFRRVYIISKENKSVPKLKVKKEKTDAAPPKRKDEKVLFSVSLE